MSIKAGCFILRKYTRCSIHDLENISKRRISVTSPKNFNDPLDSYCLDSDNKRISNSLEALISKEKQDSIRMSCFADHNQMLKTRKQSYPQSLSNEEILMWTHYGNSHQGICIEYAIPCTEFKSIDEFYTHDTSKVYLNTVDYMDALAVDYEHVMEDRTNGGSLNIY